MDSKEGETSTTGAFGRVAHPSKLIRTTSEVSIANLVPKPFPFGRLSSKLCQRNLHTRSEQFQYTKDITAASIRWKIISANTWKLLLILKCRLIRVVCCRLMLLSLLSLLKEFPNLKVLALCIGNSTTHGLQFPGPASITSADGNLYNSWPKDSTRTSLYTLLTTRST